MDCTWDWWVSSEGWLGCRLDLSDYTWGCWVNSWGSLENTLTLTMVSRMGKLVNTVVSWGCTVVSWGCIPEKLGCTWERWGCMWVK